MPMRLYLWLSSVYAYIYALSQYLCQWSRLFPWPKNYTYACDQPYHTAFGNS